MAKVKASSFVEYVRSKVGNAYLWGGQGERLYDIVAEYADTKGQSESNTVKMLGFLEDKGIKDIQFFDCSGLGVSYFLEQGAISYDMTANGFYRKCTKIEKDEIREGDMGFLVSSTGTATHIGYVVGKNKIIHALNQSKGVIEEDINKRRWVFGRPDFCLEYDLEQTIDIAALRIGDKITINKAVLGYNTAANARAGVNPVATYPSGIYYVFRIYNGTVNITRTKGTPGAWVML